MAGLEVIGVVATVVGIIDGVLALSERMINYIDVLKDAPTDRKLLSLQLKTMSALLPIACDQLKKMQQDHPQLFKDAGDALEKIIGEYSRLLKSIDEELRKAKQKWRKPFWPFKRNGLQTTLSSMTQINSYIKEAVDYGVIAMLTQIHATVNTIPDLHSNMDILKSDISVVDTMKSLGDTITMVNENVEIVKQGLASMNSNLMVLAEKYRSIFQDIHTTATQIEEVRIIIKENEHNKLAKWLSTIDFQHFLSDNIDKRVKGSGTWIVNTQKVTDWLAGKSQFLWCCGNPGVGKTMLVSIILHILKKLPLCVPVLYFFCRYKEQYEVRTILATLLKQLVVQGLVAEDGITALKDAKAKHKHLSTEELTTLLIRHLSPCAKAFVVFDAFDEVLNEESRTQLLHVMQEIMLHTIVNIMIMSRPSVVVSIQGECLNICANDQDMHMYIKDRMQKGSISIQKLDKLDQEKIIKETTKKADGMFLLVHLHIETLLQIKRPMQILSAVEILPETVEDSYNNAMERIKCQSQHDIKLAFHIISWVTQAYRPLSVSELAYALEMSEDNYSNMKYCLSQDQIISSCQGLVGVNQKSTEDYTLQEFFEKKLNSVPFLTKSDLARICLTCLSITLDGSEDGITKGIWKFPFITYAYAGWYKHIKHDVIYTIALQCARLLLDSKKLHLILQILESTQAFWNGWLFGGETALHLAAHLGLLAVIPILLEDSPLSKTLSLNERDSKRRSPLLLAVQQGHTKVIELLLKEPLILSNHEDSDGKSLLSWAVSEGHLEAAKLLLEKGRMNPNHTDRDGMTPLSWATRKKHIEIVKLLLEAGNIDCDHADNAGETPLTWAAYTGDAEVVQLLLETQNVDPNHADSYGKTPLSWAAYEGNAKVVQLSLKIERVEPDHIDKDRKTPLLWATLEGHTEIVKLLLQTRKVNPNYTDSDGMTPLSCAVRKRYPDIVKLLIQIENVNLNHSDNDGMTLLSWATCEGYTEVVKLLLEMEKVDPDYPNSDGMTPLSWAAYVGDSESVKLLLGTAKVQFNHTDINGKTPLCWAADGGDVRVVQLLLEREEIILDHTDKKGKTPLCWAAYQGHTEVAKLLLETGRVNLNHTDNDGKTPLYWSTKRKNTELAELLLETGQVIPDHPASSKGTPLYWAVRWKHKEIVELLLNTRKVALGFTDYDGMTPLSWSSRDGDTKIVQLLLETGRANVNHTDSNGMTPLSWAARMRHADVIKLLLQTGRQDVDIPDNDGMTPLSWAAYGGDVKAVKLLLDTGKVKVDHADSDGQTPLSWASRRKHVEVVKLLLETNSEEDHPQ